jgi:hypothetical protein
MILPDNSFTIVDFLDSESCTFFEQENPKKSICIFRDYAFAKQQVVGKRAALRGQGRRSAASLPNFPF